MNYESHRPSPTVPRPDFAYSRKGSPKSIQRKEAHSFAQKLEGPWQLVPEFSVVTQMPGIDADAGRLRRALEPRRVHQRAVFRGQGLEMGKLWHSADLRGVLPVLQFRQRFAADTGD